MCIYIHCVGYGALHISGGGKSGRLEFKQNDSTWGIVCDSGFDSNASLVACTQLGYDNGTYFTE